LCVKQSVDISGFDVTREANRPIKEFPFYETRLKEIDWQAAIASG